jgi:hypothetical protein
MLRQLFLHGRMLVCGVVVSDQLLGGAGGGQLRAVWKVIAKRLAVLGRADVVTLEQARRKARIYLGRVSDGVDPQEMTDNIRASASVKPSLRNTLNITQSQRNDRGKLMSRR